MPYWAVSVIVVVLVVGLILCLVPGIVYLIWYSTADQNQQITVQVNDAKNRLLFLEDVPRNEAKFLNRVLGDNQNVSSLSFLRVGKRWITFAMVASKYAVSTGFIPVSQRLESLLDALHLEKLLPKFARDALSLIPDDVSEVQLPLISPAAAPSVAAAMPKPPKSTDLVTTAFLPSVGESNVVISILRSAGANLS